MPSSRSLLLLFWLITAMTTATKKSNNYNNVQLNAAKFFLENFHSSFMIYVESLPAIVKEREREREHDWVWVRESSRWIESPYDVFPLIPCRCSCFFFVCLIKNIKLLRYAAKLNYVQFILWSGLWVTFPNLNDWLPLIWFKSFKSFLRLS